MNTNVVDFFQQKFGLLTLREKWIRAKTQTAIKALMFAKDLLSFKMSAKAMQRSIKLQFGISTREARLAAKTARPKKHRRRKHEAVA
jgi:hypothetical protein